MGISNPLRPFQICQAWALRVLAEFFDQGDEEKKLGLQVGMLNDRNTVNKPGSQHGFINFLIAPLVLPTIKIFPRLTPLAEQMIENMEMWRDLWVEEACPDPDAIGKRFEDISALKQKVKERLALTSAGESVRKTRLTSAG